jgi:hypothetical protein
MKRTPQTPTYTGIRTPPSASTVAAGNAETDHREGVLAIVHAFSGRLYGPRKYGSTLQQALAEDVSA